MFTNKTASYYSQDKVLIEAACLSTDTKPTTGVANGSKCIEMDTGKTYMFNEEDSEWEELPSSGGGGGTTVEALSVTQNGTYTAPSGKAYSPVTVNISGGSSDFSAATVTIILGEGIPTLNTSLPICTDFVDPEYPEDNYSAIEIKNSATSGEYIIPLYKGFCYLYFDSVTGVISVTGNATISSDIITRVAIYGDCTITIS